MANKLNRLVALAVLHAQVSTQLWCDWVSFHVSDWGSVVQIAEYLGFRLEQRQSRRYPARTLTDTAFADDIAQLSDDITDLKCFCTKSNLQPRRSGWQLTVKKLSTRRSTTHKVISSTPVAHLWVRLLIFSNLGSWVESTKKDVEVRIAKAWASYSKLNNARQSDHLSQDLKINFFRAAIESVHTLWLRELDNDRTHFQRG